MYHFGLEYCLWDKFGQVRIVLKYNIQCLVEK